MLPKSLKYGNKTEASMARSYTSNIQPNGALNGYTAGTVCTINIPTGPNLALIAAESVLKFTVNTSGTGAGRLDSAGAHGYIQRVRIFHGSNLLEDTDSYGLVVKEYLDLQVSTDATYGKYSILAGTRADQYVTMNNATELSKGGIAKCVNSGRKVEPDVNGVGITYCITLLSILGSLCSNNYFPLFACTSAPIRLEIQWANSIYSVGAFPSTMTGFTINNIEYIASYIALSSEAMSIIMSSQNGPLSFTLQGLRNYNTTANLAGGGSSTQINFNIPAKFASVKSIIASIRDSDMGVNKAMFFPFGSNVNGLKSYNFKIGSHSSIPSIAPSTIPQYFTEVLKAVGSISDLNHHPSIDIDSYSQELASIETSESLLYGSKNSGCFYVGLDLENYAESDKSTIYTGYNTKNDDIYLQMNFVLTTAITSARFDSFVMFDQELIFENGTCYVSF